MTLPLPFYNRGAGRNLLVFQQQTIPSTLMYVLGNLNKTPKKQNPRQFPAMNDRQRFNDAVPINQSSSE